MKILLSNDDGVHARGLHVLAKALRPFGTLWVAAPLEEKSTTGHSLTLHKPLRLIEMSQKFYGVSGSPADCVYLGVRQLVRAKPDLVVSGINRGANLGQDVYYSGTVSAAREACMMGIPSMAVSLAVDFHKRQSEEKRHYETAAKVAAWVIKHLKEFQLPKHTLLNLNVPDRPYAKLKGIRVAQQGFRHYGGSILKRKDHRGRDYYWVGGQYRGFQANEVSDCHFVEEGYASLTPLQLNSTDYKLLTKLKSKVEEEFK